MIEIALKEEGKRDEDEEQERGDEGRIWSPDREKQQEGGRERETHLMDFNDSSWEEDGSRKSKMDDGRERKEMNREGKWA